MLALAFLFVLLAFLGAAFYDFEQVALLFLQVFLTVGPFLLSGICLSSLPPALSLASPSAGNRSWSWRGSAGGDLSHLPERPCFERHHVEIVRAREVDVFLIASKMRVGFGFGGCSDLAPLIRGIVI